MADPLVFDDFPFEAHHLSVGEDWRMAYVDQPGDADAPTLLFVHGNPTWSYHWRRLIAERRGVNRCVAPDHIGCGRSDKPAVTLRLADRIDHVVELVETLDLQRIVLVAQDWGGAIGLGAMQRLRDRLAGVLLLNTGAFRPWFIPWRIRVCRTPLLGPLAMQGGNLFSRAAVHQTTTTKLSPQIARAYLAPYDSWANRRAVNDFVRDIPLGPRHPTWQTLGEIEDRLTELDGVPISLVWGLRDWCFTPECLERFQQVWPEAETTALPGAGHWVAEDAPGEVADALARLLVRVSAAPANHEPTVSAGE
ncbi:MAG: alpha/beta fold hydrolase [Planctomycetota bacterium]